MIEVIFTIDYEIYGNGEGSLQELVCEPTSELASIFKKQKATFVVFAEALEFRKMEEYDADAGSGAVREQLRWLHGEGFEIGLHLHPWWYNAQRKNGRWNLAWNDRNLCVKPAAEVEAVVHYALEYLRMATGQASFTPLSFRGGLWLMQPTQTMRSVLSRLGLKVDSSVFKGGRIAEIGLDYRAALENGYWWRFGRDVNIPESDGDFLEIPIYTEVVPFWKMLSRKRWAVHRRVPQNGNGNPLGSRRSDYLRLLCARKLDFCRMTVAEFTSAMNRLKKEDQLSPGVYKPVVAIGHSKDLVDFEAVREFLAYLDRNHIAVTDFRKASAKVCSIAEIADTDVRSGPAGEPVRDSSEERGHAESAAIPHISICICTFKRPRLLKRLLEALDSQEKDGTFEFSVVVVDNDAARSAAGVVHEFQISSRVRVHYCGEPKQNIALARNRAIANIQGQLIAFIDDDELPCASWLRLMFQTLGRYRVDGVLGPVLPHFEKQPPDWILRGGFYRRPRYATGFHIGWEGGRTGNLLFRRQILTGLGEPFRAQFGGGGEDRDFFRRVVGRGARFTWCDEAVVSELIPEARWQRRVMIKRALLRGKMSVNDPNCRKIGVAKSLLAVPLYTLALPVLVLAGEHLFMTYLIRLCDHLGRLLATIGIDPIAAVYVTE